MNTQIRTREFQIFEIQIISNFSKNRNPIQKFLNQTFNKTHFIYYIEKRSKKTMSTKMSNDDRGKVHGMFYIFRIFFLFFDTLSFRRDTLSLSSHSHTHSLTIPTHTTQLQDMEVKQSDEMMTVRGDGYEEEGDERRAQARVAFGGEQEPIRLCSPIKHQDIWDMYKKAEASFWTAEELDLAHDFNDWEGMTENERFFVSRVLAFFAAR